MAWGPELGPELELGWAGKSSNPSPSQVPLRRTLMGPTHPGQEKGTAWKPWLEQEPALPPLHLAPELGPETGLALQLEQDPEPELGPAQEPEMKQGLGEHGESSKLCPCQVPWRWTQMGPTPQIHEKGLAIKPEQGSELEPKLPQHP